MMLFNYNLPECKLWGRPRTGTVWRSSECACVAWVRWTWRTSCRIRDKRERGHRRDWSGCGAANWMGRWRFSNSARKDSAARDRAARPCASTINGGNCTISCRMCTGCDPLDTGARSPGAGPTWFLILFIYKLYTKKYKLHDYSNKIYPLLLWLYFHAALIDQPWPIIEILHFFFLY